MREIGILRLKIHPDTMSLGPAPGQHRNTTGNAKGGGAVVVSETDPGCLQTVERGTGVQRVTGGSTETVVALIGDNNDDVWLLDCGLAVHGWNRLRCQSQACNLQKISPLH